MKQTLAPAAGHGRRPGAGATEGSQWIPQDLKAVP
jgi:hypothetical protein